MKKNYTNNTDKTVFISGKLIAPGVTRSVDVIESSIAPRAFDFAALLANSVAAIPDLLVDLNLEQLEGALVEETANANRKTAIKAIETAIEDLEVNADLSEFAVSLSTVGNLDELLLKVSDNDAKAAMVEHEISLREEKSA